MNRSARGIPSGNVAFADNVELHEIPKVEIVLIPELFYSKYDYRRFKDEERFREERAVSRAIRRLVSSACAEMKEQLQSCNDVQATERELMSQSKSEMNVNPQDLVVAGSSDEESEEDGDDDTSRVKALNIQEEIIKAKRRSSLLAMPSYKSFAFEDESIGLAKRGTKKRTTKKTMSPKPHKPMDLDSRIGEISKNVGCIDLDDHISIDLDFTPLSFETVMDEQSGKPHNVVASHSQ